MKREEPSQVYLIGDSISAGYASVVRRLLDGQAIVALPPDHSNDSRTLLAQAPLWLAGRHFAAIHFNCGLHDIKRPHGQGGIQVPIEEYQANLAAVIPLLRQHAQTFIWARITPVRDGQLHPAKDFDRYNRDVDAYNRAADHIMAESHIPINDLHSVVISNGLERCLDLDGVHMTAIGYEALGQSVSVAILQHLAGSTHGAGS